jgi:lipoteichoic acid synthase
LYTPEGFTPIDPQKYDYHDLDKKNTAIEKEKGNQSTSLFSKNGNKTTAALYPPIQ